jgi:hypothetical protein
LLFLAGITNSPDFPSDGESSPIAGESDGFLYSSASPVK